MARYNTPIQVNIISGAVTLSSPLQGVLTEFTGTAPYTVQLPNPVQFPGQTLALYNATSGSITLSTSASAGSSIVGAATNNSNSYAMVTLTSGYFYSDGTNWCSVGGGGGGPGAFTTLTASSTTTFSPSGATVTISPTGAAGQVIISSPTANSTPGSMDNVTVGVTTAAAGNFSSIGATTRGTGLFTTLGANSTVTLSPAALVTISPTGGLTISPTTVAGTINNTSIGVSTQAAGSFTTLASSGATTFTRNGQGTTATDATHTVVLTGGLGVSGTIYTVGLVETSSIAFKENVNPITGALDAILKLTGVTYDRKDTKKHEAGLIAEHVYKHAPELVALDENGKPYGIHYTKVSAYLIECIKSLQTEINELKGKK
jgi:hypothetical protein